MLAWTGRAMNSAFWELRAAGVCGCSGIRSRAAQFPLNAGAVAVLSELLRDHVQNDDRSRGSVTLVPPSNWPGVPPLKKCRAGGDHSRPFASGWWEGKGGKCDLIQFGAFFF